MIKRFLLFCVLFNAINVSFAFQNIAVPDFVEQINIHSFLSQISVKEDLAKIPAPYNYLLAQPLMTKGIEKYYQRKPIIKSVYAKRDINNQTFRRAIIMFIDKNKARNNPILAEKNNGALVVEYALITINFKALPKEVVDGVLNSTTPFGQLLFANHIKITTQNRSYFSIRCDEFLSSLSRCPLNKKYYGRKNTIINVDSGKWLAKVIEILP